MERKMSEDELLRERVKHYAMLLFGMACDLSKQSAKYNRAREEAKFLKARLMKALTSNRILEEKNLRISKELRELKKRNDDRRDTATNL